MAKRCSTGALLPPVTLVLLHRHLALPCTPDSQPSPPPFVHPSQPHTPHTQQHPNL